MASKLTTEGWHPAARNTRAGKRYNSLGTRHGTAWNAKENEDLLTMADAGKPLHWLAARHGRTVNAIGLQLDRVKHTVAPQSVAPACAPTVATRATGVGSKHTGQPQGFADTNTGVYWEAMYRPGEDELRIQTALLAPAAQARATVKRWWMRPLCMVGIHWRGVSGLGMYGDASRCSICGADRYGLVVLFEDK